jgi:lysophospholipase L1-like esterase
MAAVATVVALLSLPLAVPGLAAYRSVDAAEIAKVWELPLPPLKALEGPSPQAMDSLRSDRAQMLASQILLDPQHELDHFYEALLKGGVVRVLHYGDSPTTADLITADVRSMLQQQFGDAGAGFVLIARPWAWYNHRGIGMDSANWTIAVAGRPEFRDGLFGLGGGRFSGSTGAVASWSIKGTQSQSVEVAYQARPGGGSFTFEADGAEIGTADTNSEQAHPDYVTFWLPPRASQMRVRVTRGDVQLYGVEFRKNQPGVLYSSLGVNGASVTLLSRSYNKAHLTEQLRHYRPDLVVLAYGTNESGFSNFVDKAFADEMRLAVTRVREALPDTSILLMSPMDRGEQKPDGSIGTIATLPRLVQKERQVAADMGVAFFNTFEAMGGDGTMAKWYKSQPRLVGADYIHPMPAGAKIVGELLYNNLRDGFSAYKLRKLAEREPFQGKAVQAK